MALVAAFFFVALEGIRLSCKDNIGLSDHKKTHCNSEIHLHLAPWQSDTLKSDITSQGMCLGILRRHPPHPPPQPPEEKSQMSQSKI